MYRTSGFAVAALSLSLSALLACGGSEAGQQEAAASQVEAAQPIQVAQGHQMEGHEMASQQQQAALPEGVTAEMVAQGKQLYGGAGLCNVCHGPDGEGVQGLGANLTDSEWVHSDGSVEGIAKSIMMGVDASKSSTGTAMPAKGGSGITDEQVKAVAAYVYTLSKHTK